MAADLPSFRETVGQLRIETMIPTSHRLARVGQPHIQVRRWVGTSPVSCLLVHGFAENGHAWDYVAPQLTRHVSCIAPDLRGHGDSGWADAGAYNLRSHLQDLLDVIAEHGPGPWILVGHSFGGELVSHLAQRIASPLLGVVLVDFGPTPRQIAVNHIQSLFRRLSERRFESFEDYLRVLSELRPLTRASALAHLAREDLCREADGRFRLKTDPNILGPERPWLDPQDRSAANLAALARIEQPVLLARGVGSGILTREDAKNLVSGVLSRGRLETIQGAGHAVMADNPDALAERLIAFVNDVTRDLTPV